MAVATTLVDLTDEYTKVASAGAWTTIQIVGVAQVDVNIVASGATTPTLNGFIWRVLDAASPSTWGDGDVYIKTRQADATGQAAVLTV